MSKIEPGRTISLSAMEKLYDPNFQDAIKEIIRVINPLVDVQALLKSLFSNADFQILEYTGMQVCKIKKLSTGEVFSKGDSFYHKKYKEVYKNIWFDDYFTGCTTTWSRGKSNYYIAHVRANGGLYPLSDMISMDKYNQMKDNGEL